MRPVGLYSRRLRWIIFAGHDVGPGGGQTVIDSALDELCGYASDPANEIWIDCFNKTSA